MRKIVNIGLLVFAICICCVITGQTPENDCTKDVKDKRGIMKPWEKGAWETGKYRNVFRDAGYKKAAGIRAAQTLGLGRQGDLVSSSFQKGRGGE
ncbi:MAG: hypothetical protein NTY95_09625 [Bacteroidia bacterium]|nr:hypothetical protein [Bacteroidia bacterium]